MNTQSKHYEKAFITWGKIEDNILSFGRDMMKAIDEEGKTIRDMSFRLCGNEALEDRIGRYVMAARWQEAIQEHPLYADAMEWLTPSHFTELYKAATIEDTAHALDLMEQSLVRDVTKTITESKPVKWLQAQRRHEEPEASEIYHRVWKWAVKALADAQGALSRAGLLASKRDKRRARLLALVVREFSTESEKAGDYHMTN